MAIEQILEVCMDVSTNLCRCNINLHSIIFIKKILIEHIKTLELKKLTKK